MIHTEFTTARASLVTSSAYDDGRGEDKGSRQAAGAHAGALWPVARRLWKFELEGYDRLPEKGPAILCPNHISFLDSAFLMLTVPRNI